MKNDEKLFEAYFSGRLSDDATREFTLALEKDGKLEKEYNFFLAAKKSTLAIGRDEMRAQLNQVEIEGIPPYSKTPENSSFNIKPIIKWVSGIAAILLISFWTINTLSPGGGKDLFAQNFEVYKVQAARGGETSGLKSLYQEGNYRAFLEQVSISEASPETLMMVANVQLSGGEFTEAIATLTLISDDSSLRDQKYWYLGLANFKEKNKDDAIKNLQKLLSISNYKKAETEEILSTISGD